MADERDVSRRRRELHGRIDLLRAEHTRRLKERARLGRGRSRDHLRRAARADARGARSPGRRCAPADRGPGRRRGRALGRRAARAHPRAHAERARGLLQAAHDPRAHRPAASRDHRAPARRATGRHPSTSPRATWTSSRRSSRTAARRSSCRPSSSDSTDAGMYCPECGMQNPEAAHYCARCGGLLLSETGSTPDDDVVRARSTRPIPRRPPSATSRPAARRSSCAPGDRAGEHFLLGDSRVTIGRSERPTSCSTTSRSRASTRACGGGPTASTSRTPTA